MLPIERYCLALEGFAADCDREYRDYQMCRIMGGPALESIDNIKARGREMWEKLKKVIQKILSWITAIPGKIVHGFKVLTGTLVKVDKDGTIWVTDYEVVDEMQQTEPKVEAEAKKKFDAMNEAKGILNAIRSKAGGSKVAQMWENFSAKHMKKEAVAAESFSDIFREQSTFSSGYTAPAQEADDGGKKKGRKVNSNFIKQILSKFGKSAQDGSKAAAAGVKECEATVASLSNEEASENTPIYQKVLSKITSFFSMVGKWFAEKWAWLSGLTQRLFNRSSKEEYSGPNPNEPSPKTNAPGLPPKSEPWNPKFDKL